MISKIFWALSMIVYGLQVGGWASFPGEVLGGFLLVAGIALLFDK